MMDVCKCLGCVKCADKLLFEGLLFKRVEN